MAEEQQRIFWKLHAPRFDGNSLHFPVEWSEAQWDWETVFSSTLLVPGWIDGAGQAVFEEAALVAALEAEERTVAAYLEQKRNPPTLPLGDIIKRPMCCNELRAMIAAKGTPPGRDLARE